MSFSASILSNNQSDWKSKDVAAYNLLTDSDEQKIYIDSVRGDSVAQANIATAMQSDKRTLGDVHLEFTPQIRPDFAQYDESKKTIFVYKVDTNTPAQNGAIASEEIKHFIDMPKLLQDIGQLMQKGSSGICNLRHRYR